MTEQQNELIKWLNRAFYAEKKLKALEHLRESDRERAERITSVLGSNIKGKSDTRQNNAENSLIRLACSEEKYERFLDRYISLREEVEKKISDLHNDELEALFIYRYLDYMTMEKIAEEMHYDERTIKRKHKAGIEKLSPNVTLCH
jgi:DNA-directed RNA polymerase specialized sigma24 family protein